MLASPQVSDHELIQVFLAEIYTPTYRFALPLCDSDPAAHALTRCTLALAVLERHKFWGNAPLQDWVNALVARLAQGPNPPQLEPSSSASRAEAEIEQCLEALRREQHRRFLLRSFLLASLGLAIAVALLWLAGILQILPKPKAFDPVRYNYTYRLQSGDTLESVAQNAGLSVEQVRYLNGLLPGQQPSKGTLLKLVALRPPWWQSLLPQFSDPLPPPLTLRSTPAEIRKRIENSASFWRSLWVDAAYISYGPPGYLAPPVGVIHLQVWLRRPDQGLLLEAGRGSAGGVNIYTVDGNRYFTHDIYNVSTYTQFIPNNEQGKPAQYLPFARQEIPAEDVLQVVGAETVAGRQALVVDEYNSNHVRLARLWVDTHQGLILADRQFAPVLSGSDQQPVIQDLVAYQVRYDPSIDDTLFDPGHALTSMAKDASGVPASGRDPILFFAAPALKFAPNPSAVPEELTSPPPGFDPLHSQLTLHLQALPGDDPFQAGCDPTFQSTCVPKDYGSPLQRSVQVFAGGYYLGDFIIPTEGGAPRVIACSRSPDGSRVAFNAYTRLGARLYWFDLADPGQLHSPDINDLYYSQLAFSPDSRQIAFSLNHWEGGSSLPLVALLDLNTGHMEELPALVGESYVSQVLWSPDGSRLAVIAYSSRAGVNASLYVFDPAAQSIIYSGPYDPSQNAAPGAPLQAWNGAFNPPAQGSLGCLLP